MRRSLSVVVATAVALALLAGDASAADPAADVMASLTKLSTLKYYKVRNQFGLKLDPQMQRQMDAMKSMGMPGMPDMSELMPKGGEQEFAPGLHRSVMYQKLPTRKVGAARLEMIEAKLISVALTSPGAAPKVATYIDCLECEKNLDEAARDSIKKQLSQSVASLVRSVVADILSGPAGVAAAATQIMAANPAAQAAMANRIVGMEKEMMSLNRWKCREPSGAAPPPADRRKLPFTDIEYVGEQSVDGEAAKVYRFTVTDEGTGKRMPVTFYSSAKSGLPMKMEFAMDMGPGMGGGSMTMQYYDFDVPNQIDVPDCLK